MKYVTVRIPEWALRNARSLRVDLLRDGLGSLPSSVLNLKGTPCPRCGGAMRRGFTTGSGTLWVWQCRQQIRCGFEQAEDIAEEFHGGLATLFGLGITELMKQARRGRRRAWGRT